MCNSVVRCGGGGGRDREIKKAQSCRGLRWRPVWEKTVVPIAVGRSVGRLRKYHLKSTGSRLLNENNIIYIIFCRLPTAFLPFVRHNLSIGSKFVRHDVRWIRTPSNIVNNITSNTNDDTVPEPPADSANQCLRRDNELVII